MFTRSELAAALPQLATYKTPPLEMLVLGPADYETLDHEEGFLIILASKSDVQSAIHFWIVSAQALGWQGRESYFPGFVENVLCEPLTREGFAAIVDDYTHTRTRCADFCLAF